MRLVVLKSIEILNLILINESAKQAYSDLW